MRREGGMTLLGLILVLGVVAFFALLGFRLLPAYMEYFTVKRIITDLAHNPELKGASARDVQIAFERRAAIDYLDSVKASDLQVAKSGDGISISASWQKKVPLLSNVSAVIDFEIEQ